MRSILVVVAHVFCHESLEMPLIEDNYVIQQVSSATPNPALSNPVLPRAAIRGAHRSASHLPRGGDYVAAELRVVIEQEDFVDRVYGHASRICCTIQRALGL